MKGISAFIATVLIIAFTIGVGMLLGPWIYSLAQSQSQTIGKESETRLECNYGGIRIDDDTIKCSFTGNPDFLNFTIENTGTIDLYNFTCEIYQNGVIYEYGVSNSINNQTFTSASPLRPAQKRTVSVNITDNLNATNPEWIRIMVPKCPTVSDKSTNIICT
jgi:archaellum component FlaG (FlaF/FlaG flagellin family)